MYSEDDEDQLGEAIQNVIDQCMNCSSNESPQPSKSELCDGEGVGVEQQVVGAEHQGVGAAEQQDVGAEQQGVGVEQQEDNMEVDNTNNGKY